MDREPNDLPGTVSAASPLSAVTISASLGDRRSMQIAVNLCFTDTPEMQNAILDEAMDRLDRQQARYDLDKEEEAFRQVGMNLRNMFAGMGIAENVLKNQVASLEAQIAGKLEGREEIHNAAVHAFRSSGRRSEYKPSGATKSRLNAADAEIAQLRSALEAAPRDEAQEREKLVNSIKRYQEDLTARRAKINDLRSMAGKEPNNDFMDEQNQKV